MNNKLMVVDSEQFETTQRVAKAMVSSGYFKDAADVAKAIVKIMAGQEMGLGAFASMTGINIQGGKPVLGGNLIATLIKQHPHYDYKVKTLTNQECVLVFFENGDEAGESSFSIKDAKTARVWSKKKSGFIPLTEHNQNWQSYPRNMLFARAISNGAKWFVPGIFGGAPVYTPDEMGGDGVEGEIIDVTPEPTTIDTKRELESLAVVVDHEPEHEEDMGEPEDEPTPKTNGNGGPSVTAVMIKDLQILGRFIHEDKWNDERAKISKGFGKKSSKDWSFEEYWSIYTPMKEQKDNTELFDKEQA